MKDTRIITFFTPDYAEDVSGLAATAAEFNLGIECFPLDPCSWQAAVRQKPRFIHECVVKLQGLADGVLWVDADARVRRPLDFSIFDGVDLACSLFRWSKQHHQEMLTGTLFVRVNALMREFTDRWATATLAVEPKAFTPEQDSLKAVYEAYRSRVRFLDLPIEWTWVEEMGRLKGWEDKRPIIQHLQRSRTMRAKKP